jgi:hypothetical protein
MDRFQSIVGHMGVDLRRRDIGMAQQHLDHAKIGTMIQ